MAFRLVSLPDDGGSVAPQPKRYRLVSPPAEPSPVNTEGKSDQADYSAKAVADDYANAVGQGLTKGLYHMAGSFGDARNLQNRIVNWGAEKLGASPETAQMINKGLQYANPLTAFAPSSEQLMPQAVADAPRPRSFGARVVETAADMAPQMALGPGGAVRKGVQTLATAGATEVAGPWAGLAAAIATGGKAGLRPGRVPNEQLVQQAQAAKTAAYNAAEQAGVRYTPEAFNGLVDNIATSLTNANINPLRHEKAVSVFQDIDSLRGQAPSLTQLDQLKQVIARDLLNTQDGALREFGRKMRNRIDDFIDNADETMVSSGNPQQAAQLIRDAREANRRYRGLETVTNAVTKAERRAESTGSGGNADNAMRQNIRGILDSPRKAKFFKAEEQQLMDRAIRDSGAQKAVRIAGKLSPQGSGLMAALGIGGAMTNPLLGVPALVGAAAKPLAERMTRKKIDALIEALAGKPIRQVSTDRRDALIRALLGGGAASRTE